MQIRRFFCTDLSADSVVLDEEESFHALKVLRLSPGDAMQLLDGRGTLAQAELTEVTGTRKQSRAVCRVLSRKFFALPATGNVHLYVAPPKGKNFDLILKSATELGVQKIIPVQSRYGVVHPGEKTDNHRQVLITACKQCCRPRLPEIASVMSLPEAVAGSCGAGCFGACPTHPALHSETVENWRAHQIFELWIGPEGGFAPEEEEALQQAGLQPVTVGSWTLRVETAVPAMLGYLLAKY